MSILIIDDKAKAAIKAALKRARENPVSFPSEAAIRSPTALLSLKERKRNSQYIRPASEHIMLGTYRASVSFEHQPLGLFLHLSVSSHRAGRVPGLEVMRMVAEEYGFRNFPPRPDEGRVWVEEFDPGHHAVNAVELVVNHG